MSLKELIDTAAGREKADILLTGGRLVNVISGEIYLEDVAIKNGIIIGLGKYDAKEVIELDGVYILPGFIDAHMHIESTMLTVPEFAKAVIPHGTAAVVADPHEYANVAGIPGIDYVLEARDKLPIDIFVMIPSCVPATPFETSGAVLIADDIAPLFANDKVLGLAELMNYPGTITGSPDVLAKIEVALRRKKFIDGHAPILSGKDLNAYIVAGPRSEHECTTYEEALEKLRKGMQILVREGSSERNLAELVKIRNEYNSRFLSFATDDRHPASLISEGHIDNNIRRAVDEGVSPIRAIQMATINTARYYNLRDRGAVAPGYRADIVVVDSLDGLGILKVFHSGVLVAEDGGVLFDYSEPVPRELLNTVNLAGISPDRIKITADGRRIRAIEIVPHQIITNPIIVNAKIENNFIVPDIENDILKLAVFERHHATGNIGIGFVRGFGLKRGAIASSVGHDSHNIAAVGTNDEDIIAAVRRIAKLGGGYVAVVDKNIAAEVPLPVAGLVSDKPVKTVYDELVVLNYTVEKMGCTVPEPYSIMSFLALTPIPAIRLTDKGLFDSSRFEFVPLIV